MQCAARCRIQHHGVDMDSSFCWEVCVIDLGEVLGAVLGAVYFMKPGWDHFCGKGRGLCPRRQFGHSCIKVGHSWLDTLKIKYSRVTSPKGAKTSTFHLFSWFWGSRTMSKAFSRPWGSISCQKCRIWMRMCRVTSLFVAFVRFWKLRRPFQWFGVPFLWFWDLGGVLRLDWKVVLCLGFGWKGLLCGKAKLSSRDQGSC